MVTLTSRLWYIKKERDKERYSKRESERQKEITHSIFSKEDVEGGCGVDGHLDLQTAVLTSLPWLGRPCGHDRLVVSWVEELPDHFSGERRKTIKFSETGTNTMNDRLLSGQVLEHYAKCQLDRSSGT